MNQETRRRLAIAAPAMQVAVATTLLALVWKPALLIVPVLAALFILPLGIGLWVFARRGPTSRFLLAAWAPAGQAVAFGVVVGIVRLAGDGAGVALGLLVLGPMLVLLVLGLLTARRSDRRTTVALGVLWALAILEAAVALPLAEYWGGSGGLEALAGTVTLLFAPGIALGAWLALALAARVPDGGRTSEVAAAASAPGDGASAETADEART
ncbi:MAG: hypothetical protein JW733_06005 [Coriobacteriia bacterium]|nr:hypothetical protein [Coriobacteriia bacterium]MBN2839556.1 hypothetical protein [Coriobacteriia bacterium]